MRKKQLMILLGEALTAARQNIAANAAGGRVASGLSGEGYAGGYAQAISDVMLALNNSPPSGSRYWPSWKRQREITDPPKTNP